MSSLLHKGGGATGLVKGDGKGRVDDASGEGMGCVMVHILLARQHSADELRQGEEGRDGNKSLGGRCHNRCVKIRDCPGDPLHAAIGQLDHEPSLGPRGVHAQQRKRTPIQRRRRIDNGHLTSR